MRIESRPSPNHNARPAGAVIDCVVLHADADADAGAALRYCCDPRSRVSYHTLIGRTGRIFALVPAARRAWHAGVSAFDGRPDCNDYSVGVCLSNRNDGREPFPAAQREAAALYVASLIRAYPAITLDRITTHRAVALPAGRKTDPLGLDVPAFVARVAHYLATPA